MSGHSNAKEIVAYSFLVVFANDGIIDENELHMLEKLALEDNEVDDEERRVLRNIFSRIRQESTKKEVWDEIQMFRKKYNI